MGNLKLQSSFYIVSFYFEKKNKKKSIIMVDDKLVRRSLWVGDI